MRKSEEGAPSQRPQEPLLYPLSLRMHDRLAVVVGGGNLAVRRVAGLRAARADILVVAPALSPSLEDLASRGRITVRRRGYEPADLHGAWLVLACTDQPEVNAAVAADAERQRTWCVRADDATGAAVWQDQVTGSAKAKAKAIAKAEAKGGVSIVGGGPGDPELITVAGLRRLREADVVVTDRLAPAEMLADLPQDVQVIDAGKVPGGASMRQDHINRLLVEHARAGRSVVRLKGGDPFVFGRGSEEVAACLSAGVPVTVVPGVTSAVAVPAAAGVPVTHRGLSQGFTVVSGHVSPSDPASTVDWAALVRGGTTLVLLMAVDHLSAIAEALVAAGLDPATPAACVTDGWTRYQRVVTASVTELGTAMREARAANPAVIVIGEVARFASQSLARSQLDAEPDTGLDAEPDTGLDAEPDTGLDAEPDTEPDTVRPARRVLVLGGTRSGKSAVAEDILTGFGCVDYVATGARGTGDPEWQARIRKHQQRRPAQWRTLETLDLAGVLSSRDVATPVLIDCLSTWLARVMDDCDVWSGGQDADGELAARTDGLVAAWRASPRHVVAVSSEVGSGIVPATASARRFCDELGQLNARIAACCEEVWLCTAGIAQRLR